MKKFIALFLMFLFSLSIIQPALASLQDKKAELIKIKQYLYTLDHKIKKARAQRRINKISELKELKRAELARAKVLKAEIAKLESQPGKAPKPIAKPMLRQRGFLVEGGFGCGGGLVRGGYLMPIRPNMDLIIDAGMGIGNGFSVIVADLGGRMLIGRGFAGLEVTMANYSQTVSGVPGVSGNLGGSNTGIGFYGGTNLGMIEAKVGYNTAVGLNATGVYRF